MSMFSHSLTSRSTLSASAWLRYSLSVLILLASVGCQYFPKQTGNGIRTDEAPLSLAVAQALGANAQTSQLHLMVSNPTEGKVRLEGNVSNDGLRVSAEQVAAQVDGVRSVINTLYLY